GRVREYVGGYQDWLRQGGSPRLLGAGEKTEKTPAKSEPVAAPSPVSEAVPVAKKKLSYKLQRELEALPGQIDALEQQLAALQAETADPAFYLRAGDETSAALAQLERLQ